MAAWPSGWQAWSWYCVAKKGPKCEKRPADVIGDAVKVMRIATGEEAEDLQPESAAATLGKLGYKTRAANSAQERRKIQTETILNYKVAAFSRSAKPPLRIARKGQF